MKVKTFLKKLQTKLFCKKGDSNLISNLALAAVVLVIIAAFLMPWLKKTTEHQFDKSDQKLEEIWDYK